MSDILLSVGLQKGNVGFSQLEVDIKEVVARISKNPPKVNVGLQVDQAALNNFKSQLTQIVNSVRLSTGAPITVNISGIGEITAQADKAKKALDDVAKSGNKAADATNKMGTTQMKNALTQIDKQIKSIQTNYAKWTAAAEGQSKDSYAVYGQQVQVLEDLRTKVEANQMSWEQFREALASIKQTASEAATAINKVGEDHSATKVTVLERNTEEYRKALAKCNSELVALRKNQEQWTAAKNGKGADDYAALGQYEKQIESLIADLSTGKMTMDDFTSRFGAIKAAADGSRSSIRGFGEDTKSLGSRLSGLAEKFGLWLSVSQVIMQAVRVVKQMVTNVRDVDAAMTELRKVTDETGAVYDKFLSNAGSRAKDVGASISDIVSATADFARLGYGIDEASALADIAIMYKNIGDGVDDVNQATESIVSTMQAFGILPEEAMHIVDVFNAVGNNFAISSGGIGDALQRSAAAMNAAGNTLEETAALVAAANTVVQDPDSVGTTLKTVSMFLRASKVEAEEAGESTEGMAHSVSELRDKLLTLTDGRVDILLDSGKYKDTYEILRDIAAVWSDIVSNQGTDSAAILELIGGKRNANVVAAILENFHIAEDALRVAMESSGSAIAENEKHLDSINGKIEIFKAAFQELSVSLVSSDLVKGVIDFGTGLVSVMTSITQLIAGLGGLNTVLLSVCATMLIAKGGLIALKTQMIATAVVSKLVAVFNAVKTGLVNVIQIIPNAIAAWKAYSAGIVSASTAMQASIPIIGLVLAAVTMLVGGLSLYNSKAEENRQEAISNAASAAELGDEISSLAVKYLSLSEAVKTDKSVKESLISTQDALIEKLGLEQYEIDNLIEKYGSLSDAILQTAKDELGIAEISLTKGLDARVDELHDAAEAIYDTYEYTSNYVNGRDVGYFSDGSLFPSDEDYKKYYKHARDMKAAFDALKNAGYLGGNASATTLTDINGEILGLSSAALDLDFDLDSAEGIVKARDTLQEMLTLVDSVAGDDNAIYDYLEEGYFALDSAADNYTDSVGKLNANLAQQYVIQGLIGSKVPATQSEFDTYRQSVIDAAIASDEFVGSAEQIEGAIDSVLKQDASFAHFYTNITEGASSAATSGADAWKSYTEQLATILKDGDISSISNEITTLADALSKLQDGTLEADDVITLIEQFPELSEYVDFTADKFGDLETGLRDLIKSSPEEFVKTLQEFKEVNNITGEAADQIDALCNAVNSMSADAIRDVSGEFGVLAESINNAKKAQNALEAALAEDDWDSGYDGRVSAFEGFQEVFNAGEYGSKAYSAYKKYFGIEDKDSSGVKKWMEDNKKYFTEGTDGVLEFMKTVEQLGEVDSSFKDVATFDSSTGAFWYDINRLSDFAKELGWTEQMVQDFIYKYRMYCEEWESRSAQDNLTELSEAGYVFDVGSETFASLDKLMEYTGLTKDGVIDLVTSMNELRKQQGLDPIQLIGSDQITITQATIDNLLEAGATADQVKSLLLDLNGQENVTIEAGIELEGQSVEELISDVTGDGTEAVSVDITMTVNDKEVIATVTTTAEQIKAILGEDWAAKISADSADAEARIDAVNKLLTGLPKDTLVTVSDSTAGVRSSLSSVQSYLQYISNNANKTITITYSQNGAPIGMNASGTRHATRGLSLLGDEYSPDGSPKPELVVSNGRAYLAGQNGPEIGYLNEGDIVYNATETKRILRGNLLHYSIQAHAGGTANGLVGNGGFSGGNHNFSGSAPESNSKGKKKKESWFEREYKDHQHLLAMDQESVDEYLKWLEEAYQKAYEEGLIDLDEYYEYQEEVYQGIQDQFKDHVNDIDHEISMLEAGVGNSDEIINLSLQAMKDIEDELAAARAAGLDENSDYIQWLEQQWMSYSENVTSMRERAEAEAQSTVDNLVEYRIKMLKQEIQDQKDALSKQLKDLQDFYDKQRKMLQDQYDEEKYLEEQKEKRKSVTDIRSELAMLENDNSAWAQKRKLELQAELAEAEKDLNSFERDHALDVTLGVLDEQQAAQEAQIQAQMDALDEKLNDPHALFNQALEDIKNNTSDLYQQFIDYNRKHGTGNDQDIADMWEEAHIADLEYQDTHNGEHKDGIEIGNYTGYVAPETPAPKASDPPPDPKPEPEEPQLTAEIKEKVAAAIWNGKYGWGSGSTRTKRLTEVFGANNGIQDLVRQGVGKSGVSLTDEYTYKNMRKKFKGYKSGTDNATPGWHKLFEGDLDEYVFTSSDGNKYRMFSGLGDKVLNGEATDFLYNFANSGGTVLTNMLADLLGHTRFGNMDKPIQAVEIHSGDIIVQGNASERTVSEIRRAQRDNLEFVLKELNRLNK